MLDVLVDSADLEQALVLDASEQVDLVRQHFAELGALLDVGLEVDLGVVQGVVLNQ